MNPKPMTEEQARVEAKKLLGEDADVHVRPGYPPYTVGRPDGAGFLGYGSGVTWEEALKAAKGAA